MNIPGELARQQGRTAELWVDENTHTINVFLPRDAVVLRMYGETVGDTYRITAEFVYE